MPDFVFKPKFDYFLTSDQAKAIAGDFLQPDSLKYRLQAQAVVTLKQPPSDRLKRQIQTALDQFVVEHSRGFTKKMVSIMDGVGSADAAEAADAVQKWVSVLMSTLPGEFEDTVNKVIADEAKRDDLVREFKIKTVFKLVVGATKIAKNATSLAFTAAVDASAWLGLCKAIKEVVDLVRDAAKAEDQLYSDLLTMRDLLQKTTGKAVQARIEYEKSKGPLKRVKTAMTKFEYEYKLKSRAEEAEKKRQFYRTKVYDTRKKIDKLDPSLRKLEEEFKSLKGSAKDPKVLKVGVQVGAALMAAKRGHRVAVEAYQEKLETLDRLNKELAILSVEIDDKTWKQKLDQCVNALKSRNFGEVKKSAEEAKGVFDDIKDAVENIQDAIKSVA
ncbi:MAG TPA: hypothetical protein VGE52_15920 [Pirellulales bacterium]